MMPEKISKSDLKKYIQEYYKEFSEWVLVRNEFMIRFEGPIAQVIGFENLRMGAYRPISGVHILIAPGATMLHQFLDIKHRVIFPKQHNRVFRSIIQAMEEQFIPNIRQPLNVEEVCKICESHALDKLNDIYAVCALYTYLTDKEKSCFWIDKFKNALEIYKNTDPDYCKQYQLAFEELESVIKNKFDTIIFEDNIMKSTNRLLKRK